MAKRGVSLIDSRLIPNIISFKYPKSGWVRAMLVLEMVFAVLILLGTLVMLLLPQVAQSTFITTIGQ